MVCCKPCKSFELRRINNKFSFEDYRETVVDNFLVSNYKITGCRARIGVILLPTQFLTQNSGNVSRFFLKQIAQNTFSVIYHCPRKKHSFKMIHLSNNIQGVSALRKRLCLCSLATLVCMSGLVKGKSVFIPAAF